MGLIGPNGAGKSTTIRILMGLVHQDAGEVRVLGHRMPAEQVAAKWDIGFASEDMRLYEAMTLDWHMNFIRSIYPTWDAAYAQILAQAFWTAGGAEDQRHSRTASASKRPCCWFWPAGPNCWCWTNRPPASTRSRATRFCAN